jgi:hypothetical protein
MQTTDIAFALTFAGQTTDDDPTTVPFASLEFASLAAALL